MLPLSVVIITKNEARNIAACIRSARTISDDIVVVDAESEDDTALLATLEDARVVSLKWKGYGYARNTGAAMARHDWIFSLDADERITRRFAGLLDKQFVNDASFFYSCTRRNFFGDRVLAYGIPGFEKVARLYNRTTMKWDRAPVHERLTGTAVKKRLPGAIDHYAIADCGQYTAKRRQYAYLCAIKYMREGKKAGFLKRYFAAPFHFVRSYCILLGFLDGAEGFSIARMNARYTWLKYHYLHWLTTTRHPVINIASRQKPRVTTGLTLFSK